MVFVQCFHKTFKTKTPQSPPKPVPKSLINPRHKHTVQPLHFYCKRFRNSQAYAMFCLSQGHLGLAQGFAAVLVWQKATALAEHLLSLTSARDELCRLTNPRVLQTNGDSWAKCWELPAWRNGNNVSWIYRWLWLLLWVCYRELLSVEQEPGEQELPGVPVDLCALVCKIMGFSSYLCGLQEFRHWNIGRTSLNLKKTN